MAAGRTLIVGDVHGCLDELLLLLSEVAFRPDEDRLIATGDLVGKGPSGAEVIRFFREGGHEAVRGNHDERILEWWRVRSLGLRARPLKPTHAAHALRMDDVDWAWLAERPLFLRLPEENVLVLHAGLDLRRPLVAQHPRDLMNTRSIRGDGAPSRRLGRTPWASRWRGPEHIVFGHDAVRGLQQWPHATGLDTGCVYGHALTALVLPAWEIVSVSARRVYVPAA
jgi:hypothetical protein